MLILPMLRDELPAYFTSLGLTGTGVEVGTYMGNFADCWLSQWPGTLHCVDPWAHQPDQADALNHDQGTMDGIYATAQLRLAPHIASGRCHLHRAYSVEEAQADWAQDLDVVYIDARHDFAHVYADLVAWFPKVKSGGIIAGHDYLAGTFGDTEFGVEQAVWTFFPPLGYQLEADLMIVPDPFPSWVLRVK